MKSKLILKFLSSLEIQFKREKSAKNKHRIMKEIAPRSKTGNISSEVMIKNILFSLAFIKAANINGKK